MVSRLRSTAAHNAALLLLFTLLAGCATGTSLRSVAPGDQAGVQFTCRLPSGEIAVSSRADAGGPSGERLSALFLAREASDPIILVAGAAEPLPPGKIRPLEEDVLQQLRGTVVGMRKGESRSAQLHATLPPDEKPGDGVVKMNRTRHYDKEERLSLAAYREQSGKEPVVGDPYASSTHEPQFRAVVDSATDQEVVIRYSIEPGTRIPVFFGTGTIADAGATFDLRIDTEEGRLVRNGYLTGRVVQVSDSTVAVDFADKFGGFPLSCSVTLESVADGSATHPGVPAALAGESAGKFTE
jgi:hypothetical protein